MVVILWRELLELLDISLFTSKIPENRSGNKNKDPKIKRLIVYLASYGFIKQPAAVSKAATIKMLLQVQDAECSKFARSSTNKRTSKNIAVMSSTLLTISRRLSFCISSTNPKMLVCHRRCKQIDVIFRELLRTSILYFVVAFLFPTYPRLRLCV